jgi:hypothetical protein
MFENTFGELADDFSSSTTTIIPPPRAGSTALQDSVSSAQERE